MDVLKIYCKYILFKYSLCLLTMTVGRGNSVCVRVRKWPKRMSNFRTKNCQSCQKISVRGRQQHCLHVCDHKNIKVSF